MVGHRPTTPLPYGSVVFGIVGIWVLGPVCRRCTDRRTRWQYGARTPMIGVATVGAIRTRGMMSWPRRAGGITRPLLSDRIGPREDSERLVGCSAERINPSPRGRHDENDLCRLQRDTESDCLRLSFPSSQEDIRAAGVQAQDWAWLSDGEVIVGGSDQGRSRLRARSEFRTGRRL